VCEVDILPYFLGVLKVALLLFPSINDLSEDVIAAEKLMRKQWSSRLTAIQNHLDAQKRASILEETEDRKLQHRNSDSKTNGKEENGGQDSEFVAPKGVISLAFTDIQGSTRLWEHFGEVREGVDWRVYERGAREGGRKLEILLLSFLFSFEYVI
jgi:hypothetical protein